MRRPPVSCWYTTVTGGTLYHPTIRRSMDILKILTVCALFQLTLAAIDYMRRERDRRAVDKVLRDIRNINARIEKTQLKRVK